MLLASLVTRHRLAAKEKELNELYANKENGEWSEEDLVGFGESKEEGGADDEDCKQEDPHEEHKSEAASPHPKLLSSGKDETVVEFLATEVYSPDAKGEQGFVVEEDSDDE